MTETVSVGLIGGSGLYSLFDPSNSEQRIIETPYGSAEVTIGEFGGKRAAFLTRHGAGHTVPPHLIEYRANVWALASLGAKVVLSSSAVGGVSPDYPAGSLVLTDQFIDRTHGRSDTFYDQDSVQHLASADPFAPELHELAASALLDAGIPVITAGTVVVVQGPRFSTRAESLWYRSAGAHIVNMTMYPEVALASELNLDTVNLSFVTDADAGLAPIAGVVDEEAVSAELVFRRLAKAQPLIVRALEAIAAAIPEDYTPRQLISPTEVARVLAKR